MKFYVLLFSLFAAIAFTSCGDSCDSATYGAELTERSTTLSASATAYTNDPTNSSLCMDYSAELEEQIAFYEKYQDCDEINVTGSLDALITSTQTAIDALDCN